ncbi:sensor histidine kinase [Marinobacterium lacunae]|uniref:Sensor histidine kinase n=1 Tax=Marinobacterium lacunae TaxID=1232683 RepID=A0A081G2Z1_9GAMM|nr:response regulator transcription factor [Marinobacterium lacunae]KEA65146.1 sensor histidine kinase [Marinobacterium lacunae]MBR9884009.1 response regulator transcription factor [Oceanospirillales bacterium]
MTRILVIDDEPQIRRFLNISLSSQGYEILEAESGREGLQKAALETPDLIILDLGLPDMDGQRVLRDLRIFYSGPVIVLSVRNSEREKVQALDSGCNDYVEKPFGVKELLARIRAVLRTFSTIEVAPAGYEDQHLKLDIQTRRVLLDGEPVHFSRKEFDLLAELVSYPGRILTQQYLLRKFWGETHIDDTHYLRIFIRQIRNKLGDRATAPVYIETEPGVGYRFIGGEGSGSES